MSSESPTRMPLLKFGFKGLVAISFIFITYFYGCKVWNIEMSSPQIITMGDRNTQTASQKIGDDHRNTQTVSQKIGDDHRNKQTASQISLSSNVEEDIDPLLEPYLKERSDANKAIILSVVDFRYIDMALNLWESSFLKLGITNYLFACLDDVSIKELEKNGIPCYSVPSLTYNATKVQHKQKREIVINMLLLGYSVLYVDLDIVFFKNPFPYLQKCVECDIQWQVERVYPALNAGLTFARPTAASLTLHREVLKLQRTFPTLSDQYLLEQALRKMQADGAIKDKALPVDIFPVGSVYFEVGDYRMFAGDSEPCSDCVLVHNNWMAGFRAKRYRFRENLLWHLEKDQYYSSKTRKYLTFDNPIDFSLDSLEHEVATMRAALSIGRLLNRTVILPTFHCHGSNATGKYSSIKNKNRTHCAMNVFLNIARFDEYFDGLYREHMFLHHYKVPAKTKKSLSGVILIQSRMTQSMVDNPDFREIRYKHKFTPKNIDKGATSQEILDWFQNSQFQRFQVLRFHSLYGVFAGFLPNHQDDDFGYGLCRSFKKTSYRQVGPGKVISCRAKLYNI